MMQCLNCSSQEVKEIIKGQNVYYLCADCGKVGERVFEDDGKIFIRKHSDGRHEHHSVAAIIEKDGKMLLTMRRRYPFGYHLLTGHINRDETPEQALNREIFEETSNVVKRADLIFSKELEYSCRAGADWHKFFLYKAEVEGPIILRPDELLSFHFVGPAKKVSALKLSMATRYLLHEAGLIP